MRRNTAKQVAVKVWAAELYDYMMKEDNVGKLPEFVVSSHELQRVPLALMSGANDVLPVCTKMNILEKKMEDSNPSSAFKTVKIIIANFSCF